MNFKMFLLFGLAGFTLLLFQCASQQSSRDSMTEDDEQFRQELLAMLEDAEDSPDTAESEQTDDEILTILNEDPDQVETSDNAGDTRDSAQNENDDWWSETDDIWADTEEETSDTRQSEQSALEFQDEFTVSEGSADVGDIPTTLNKMEMSLDQKSKKLDSLRQVLEDRGERLDQLENKMRSAKSGGSVSGGTSGSSGFSNAYRQARSQFEQKNYQACIQSMQTLLQNYPSSNMADNCQYWIAESYFGLGQYEKAVIEFQKVFAYEPTDKHDDAQLMIALSYRRMGQTEQAQQAFQSFLDSYPDSEYIGLVRKYMNL
ncbi:MAG: tetratricopeptide repeat protein [candidate division KSB1 bacterium]|nr:tetratricopeptide repeat protein [candidate division KSB1 bacterium]